MRESERVREDLECLVKATNRRPVERREGESEGGRKEKVERGGEGAL